MGRSKVTEQEYKERCDFLNDMMEEARSNKTINIQMFRSIMGYAHAERDKAYEEYKGILVK